MKILVKKIHDNAIIPEFAHATDSGADLYTSKDLSLAPRQKGIAPTGICIALPPGFGATIRNKSGNTVKGVSCKIKVNEEGLFASGRVDITVYLGTIDNAYRGEIGIMVRNDSDFPIVIPKGTKLAQLVLEKIYQCDFEEVDNLDETDRGEGGFGSTGH
jgi:dUTP pyrophosphatase